MKMKDDIQKLISDLMEQKNILEKFEIFSDFDRGLFLGKINQINSVIDRLKQIEKNN